MAVLEFALSQFTHDSLSQENSSMIFSVFLSRAETYKFEYKFIKEFFPNMYRYQTHFPNTFNKY